MRRTVLGGALTAVIGLCLPDVGRACGDKLVVLGRGVRFERLHMAKHPCSVLLFMDSDSALAKADKEFHLRDALELAGHTVGVVASRAELERALSANQTDLVITDLADARALRNESSSDGAGPEILPILYKPTAEELAQAQTMNPCLGQAAKRKSGRLLEVVDEMMAQREKGERAACSPSTRKGA